jgi:hypothetical protein
LDGGREVKLAVARLAHEGLGDDVLLRLIERGRKSQ